MKTVTHKWKCFKIVNFFSITASSHQGKNFLEMINEYKLSRTTHNPIMSAIDPHVINDVHQTAELHRITSSSRSGSRNPIQREIYHFTSSAEKFNKEYWKYQEQNEK